MVMERQQEITVEVFDHKGVKLLAEEDVIDGGDVLPGFTMRVKDVFADPAEDEQ